MAETFLAPFKYSSSHYSNTNESKKHWHLVSKPNYK